MSLRDLLSDIDEKILNKHQDIVDKVKDYGWNKYTLSTKFTQTNFALKSVAGAALIASGGYCLGIGIMAYSFIGFVVTPTIEETLEEIEMDDFVKSGAIRKPKPKPGRVLNYLLATTAAAIPFVADGVEDINAMHLAWGFYSASVIAGTSAKYFRDTKFEPPKGKTISDRIKDWVKGMGPQMEPAGARISSGLNTYN